MDTSITQEDQEALRGFGEYLGRLLVSSTLSDEQKQAWATLVPEMSLEQMNRLAGVLEKYLPQVELPGLQDFRAQMQRIQEQYNEQVAVAQHQAQSDLVAVMDEVKAAEAAA